MPFDEYQAWCRSIATLNASYPAVWTVYNDGAMGEIWIFPLPVQANEMELDCLCLPSPLYSDDDPDLIPGEMVEAIKYGAARRAFQASQRCSSERNGRRIYASLGNCCTARDRGRAARTIR